jgi:glycosyltransferase involved in cell wall biosynthesis
MADLLNSMGHRASVVHQQPGFELRWFKHTTSVETESEVRSEPGDWAVISEDCAFGAGPWLPGVRKVIYNQNAYYTFKGSTLAGNNYCPYFDPEVKATIVISEDSARYIGHAFPKARVLRHFYGFEPEGMLHFVPPERKQRRLAFMPRKNPNDAIQVIQILRCRNILADWQIQIIENMSAAGAAEAMKESAVFLSFGHPEGFGMPPAEAMLCGCVVIGYHGNAGREFLTAEHGYPVDAGQIVEFAQTVESVLLRWAQNPRTFSEMCIKARDYIRATYNPKTERASLERVWGEISATT